MHQNTRSQGQSQGQRRHDQRLFEEDLLERDLQQITKSEKNTLLTLGYRDPVHVFDALRNVARLNRKQRRAMDAGLVLGLVEQVRSHVFSGNTAMAAHYALRIGTFAEGLARKAMDGAGRDKARLTGGIRTGEQQHQDAETRWNLWQTIADGLTKRNNSRLWAATQVQIELDRRKVKPLPKIDTIRKRITYPKKLARS